MNPRIFLALSILLFPLSFLEAQESPIPSPEVAGEIVEPVAPAAPVLFEAPVLESTPAPATQMERATPVASPTPKARKPFFFKSGKDGFAIHFDSDEDKDEEAKGESLERAIEKKIEAELDSAGVERETGKNFSKDGGTSNLALLIPIFGIVFSFGIPALIVAMVLAYRMKKNRLLHETIQKLVASGQPIPPELLASSGAKTLPSAKTDFRKGIIFATIGCGWMAYQLAEGDTIGLGIIPLTIGVGYLLTAKLAPRDSSGDKS